ncbi:hypothetical protein [Methylobacter sp. sgz302048]|uniref:hypothetical protein n=1 Tax=Methylobacter sp. sgz302048 TaxID=3455945 RepID=UPI003FA18F18
MKWFVRTDLDGFFGLALDNLVQLLVIVGLCDQVLGFSEDLIYRHILPGVAVSLLIDNIYYAHQAKQLAAATGRAMMFVPCLTASTPCLYLLIFF